MGPGLQNMEAPPVEAMPDLCTRPSPSVEPVRQAAPRPARAVPAPANIKSQTITYLRAAFPAKNKKLLAVGAGLVALFVLVFGFLMRSSSEEEVGARAEISATDEVAPEQKKEAPQVKNDSKPAVAEPAEATKENAGGDKEKSPLPERVKLTVNSEPMGAEVRRNGMLLGRTPLELHPERSDAPFRLHFALNGFGSTEESVTPDADKAVRALLSPVAAPQVQRRTPRRKSRVDPGTKKNDKIDKLLD